MIIDDIKDARDGDWIKGEYLGHPFEGAAWTHLGDMKVGDTRVQWGDDDLVDSDVPAGVTILSIERPEPILPLELGSVIANALTSELEDPDNDESAAEIRHGFLVFDALGDGNWWSPFTGNTYFSSSILSFTPAKVVPE